MLRRDGPAYSKSCCRQCDSGELHFERVQLYHALSFRHVAAQRIESEFHGESDRAECFCRGFELRWEVQHLLARLDAFHRRSDRLLRSVMLRTKCGTDLKSVP